MKVRVPNIGDENDGQEFHLEEYPVLEGNGPIAVDVEGNVGVVVDGELVGYVEEEDGSWWADISFGHAPNVGPFKSRSAAMREFVRIVARPETVVRLTLDVSNLIGTAGAEWMAALVFNGSLKTCDGDTCGDGVKDYVEDEDGNVYCLRCWDVILRNGDVKVAKVHA